MLSMAWTSGLHALTKTSQYSCLCCIEKVAYYYARTCRQGVRPTQLSNTRWKSSTAVLTTNGLPDGDDASDGKILKEGLSVIVNGADHSNKVKILLIENSSKVQTIESEEAPLLHHAQKGAVVDIQRIQPEQSEPPSNETTTSMEHASHHDTISTVVSHDVTAIPHTTAAHLDTRSHSPTATTHTTSLPHTTPFHTPQTVLRWPVKQLLKDSQKSVERAKFLESYEESYEFVEEPIDRKRETTELVGALPAGALDWRPQQIEIKKLGSYYAALSKSRLTGLVVITAVAGYAMAPTALDPVTLLCCSLGTGLTSSAANTINQFFEVPYDSQMDRTKNRVLVRGLVSPLHAICFACVCSTGGIGLLYLGANGLAAGLGALNLLLYTTVYTPMKRISILNTWVGSLVGAIPPLIGWSSCTGGLEAGAWVMAGLLYAWQFPHFNSLSWNLRPDYSRAGYRMMSVTNPGLCRRVALRYSLAMIGLCTLAPVIDVTTWTFAADSLPLNGYLTYLALRFYKDADSKSSRKLFLFTLIHLPVIMILMIISKKHYHKNKSDVAVTSVSATEL